VPIVLNTSFNENEPVVCRPEEAVNCFLRTRMDAIVMHDTVIRRRPARRLAGAGADGVPEERAAR
jgi:carbamoyltransferase